MEEAVDAFFFFFTFLKLIFSSFWFFANNEKNLLTKVRNNLLELYDDHPLDQVRCPRTGFPSMCDFP
jgi:hypothetical protein